MTNVTPHRTVLMMILAVVFGLNACERQRGQEHQEHVVTGDEKAHDERGVGDISYEKGPHGGRMFREGDFAAELQLFEQGVPPQYRVYGYENNVPIMPRDYSIVVSISRLGRNPEIVHFTEQGELYLGDRIIEEPHSFDVTISANHQGRSFEWRFSSYEGRTALSDQVAALSGIRTEQASPQRLRLTTHLSGTIRPSEHRIAHVMPRFSGVIKEGKKHIGDPVAKGEVLAVIESNQSLQPFEVRSQIAGTVVEGHVVPGEFVPDNTSIYTIADYSEMWVDCYLPLREENAFSVGQVVRLSSVHGDISAEGTVLYIAPYADEHSQSRLIRLVAPNKDGKLLPGMYVAGEFVVQERTVPLAVKRSAIQSFRDWHVVFRVVKGVYEVVPITEGITNQEWVEVLSGLQPGDQYVSENSFLIKADILKSGASHDH